MPGPGAIVRGGLGHVERDGDRERRALPGRAGDADVAAQAATSFRQIARPSPVPPYCRVVDWSACEKASKMVASLSGGMPMPVSFTAIARMPGRSATGPIDSCTEPCSVNLSALLIRLPITCDSRTGSPVMLRGVVRVDNGGEIDALAAGPLGKQADRRVGLRGHIDRQRLELELAGLDLREIQDVVDDRKQALARIGDHVRAAPLARAASPPWRAAPPSP